MDIAIIDYKLLSREKHVWMKLTAFANRNTIKSRADITKLLPIKSQSCYYFKKITSVATTDIANNTSAYVCFKGKTAQDII